MQKQKGFTIVEALIVIVIVGILAAIVLTAVNGFKGASNGEPQFVIDTADGSRYWASAYEEKDGCVTFDTWRGSSKACGSYTIRQRF
jgi:prepilin-type N-terminal cleavage/methylation domain-containing protein